ncbi:hypothetical protein AQ1_02502 [alpha proteobacterium Q-1]|nr:hypothetical protein AQ1_02502 [alpha proteobacterium Q-1]
MVLISSVVKELSEMSKIEETSVATYARALREAGLLSQKGRGRGAAHATPLDAARLLIALMVGGKVKDSPQAVRDFGKMRCTEHLHNKEMNWKDTSLQFLCGVPNEHIYEEAIAAIIEGFGVREFQEKLKAETEKTKSPYLPVIMALIQDTKLQGQVIIGNYRYSYQVTEFIDVKHNSINDLENYDEDVAERWLAILERYSSGINREAEVGTPQFINIGQVLAGVREPGERETNEEWADLPKQSLRKADKI